MRGKEIVTETTTMAIAGIVGFIIFGGSIVAWIKFWMDLGAQKSRIDSAIAIATGARNGVELVKEDIGNFKNQIAFEILPRMLNEHEKRIADMISEVRGDLKEFRKDIGEIHRRIDGQRDSRDRPEQR